MKNGSRERKSGHQTKWTPQIKRLLFHELVKRFGPCSKWGSSSLS